MYLQGGASTGEWLRFWLLRAFLGAPPPPLLLWRLLLRRRLPLLLLRLLAAAAVLLLLLLLLLLLFLPLMALLMAGGRAPSACRLLGRGTCDQSTAPLRCTQARVQKPLRRGEGGGA